MLAELTIRDFAIINELQLHFDPGFNVLTGETGAGKSIILDAVMLVLGARADTSLIRAGAGQAQIEATFRLGDPLQRALAPLLEAEGLESDSPGYLHLAREIRSNGRNLNRVNGRVVNLSLIREVGERLIDIHGQGEHLSLLRPKAHLPLLDAYAGLEQRRAAVKAEVDRLRAVRQELSDLQRDARLLRQREDLLRFQVEEIGEAGLSEDEEKALGVERTRLSNAEQLSRLAAEALHLLGGGDDDQMSAADLLSAAERPLGQLARLDESQAALLERVAGLASELSEVTRDVDDYRASVEADPARLDEIEERLELIRQLKRKYGDTIAAVLAVADNAAAELDKISHSEERMEALQAQEAQLLAKIGELSAALSKRRKAAADKLSRAVEIELTDLKMAGARFAVDFKTHVDEAGVPVGAEKLAFDGTGIDRVEFLLTTNPGEPLKPMARVASGGETARLMLALKTALARVDETPTLIFDEIDQGIGGRVGDTVGRKLWGLTAVGRHQVIVVTHLPQLAGYGDRHLRVSKGLDNGRTITHVSALDESGRISELAEMLGTQGEHAVGGAEEILSTAARAKRQPREPQR